MIEMTNDEGFYGKLKLKKLKVNLMKNNTNPMLKI